MKASDLGPLPRRREALDKPYATEHTASLSRSMRPPKNLPQLLAWFLEGFRDEMPEEMHSGPLWIDRTGRGDPDGYKPVGGSLLGTPGTADPFRALIEDSPFATEVAEYEGHKDKHGHYARPMRAAIARLGGRGPDTADRPYMARVLLRVAYMDGDLEAACRSFGIPAPVHRPYVEAALWHLWRLYRVEPEARPIDEPRVA